MDIFSTNALRRVVAALDEPASFLLDTFFPNVQTSDTEEISFDVEERGRRITPFVSPLVAGKVVDQEGFRTSTFKPAYAKDKRRFEPNRPLKRAMGEQIGAGNLSPMERRAVALRQQMEDQLRMLTRREEVMAASALVSGTVTVTGEGFPTKVVDFGRDASLGVTLTSTDRWGEDGVKPVDDIEAWAALVQSASGAVPTEVVMDPEAWKVFRANEEVQRLLDTRRGSASRAETGPMDGRKVRQPGILGDFRFWVYQDHYIDEAGATQQLLPDHTVILGGGEIEGARAYGVIQDEEAGYASQRFHVKSWLEKDPAVRWLLLQSAPLVVPYRPNASLRATVR